MNTFKKLTKITVLNEFKRFHRLFTAYNCENFHGNCSRQHIQHSIFYAFGATLIILSISTFSVFAIWYLIEKDADLKKFVASLPLIFGLLNNVVTFIVMMMKGRIMQKAITQMDTMVDKREFFCSQFCMFATFCSKFDIFSHFVQKMWPSSF